MRWFQRAPVRLLLAGVPVVGFIVGVELLAPALGGGTAVRLVEAVGVLALYVGYVRLVERRQVDELRGPGALAELARGLVFGAALFASTIAVIGLLGACTVERGDGTGVIALAVGSAVAAVVEETLMRAILFRIVESSLGTWIALLLSAALFGVGHAFNPGASVASTLAIALEAGVLLAAALVVTRRMWLAFGLHAAWNFTEGGVFGAAVSGFNHPHGVLLTRFHGSAPITGGAFGPEASIVAIGICLTAGCLLLVRGHRRGRFVAPFWRREAATAASHAVS
jgi:CAAX protease family protein